MPLPFNQLVRAILAGGGGAAGLPALSSFALVGDSLTQFGFSSVALNAVTLTRDAAGTVTFTKANHGIYGPSSPVYLLNCNDQSYEGEYIATSVDANTLSLAGGLAGAAGTTTTTGLGAVLQTNRIARRGSWAWLNSARNGGLVLSGVFAQGGDGAEAMVNATAQAIAKGTDAIILEAGVNNINPLGQSAAVAWGYVKALIDQINAGGRVAICCALSPVSSANAGYTPARLTAAQDFNALMQAYCLASPANRLFVDTFTPLFNPATQEAYSWVTYDSIHRTVAAAKVHGEAIGAAIAAATAQAPVLLPVSAADAGVVNGWTRHVRKGPWVNTGGGTFGGGMSGTAPAGSSWTRSATGTGVCSIVDPGDGKGLFAQAVCTPAAANETFTYWPWTNTSPTIAALGIATTDTVRLACEVEWSGGQAANLARIELAVDNRTGAAPFVSNSLAADGTDAETLAVRYPDAGTQVFVTGPLKMDAAAATMSLSVAARFFAASASACTIKVRRVTIFKL